jgi:uncharacterized protein YegL
MLMKSLWRTLLLVLLGLLVILAMWAYVVLTQHRPAADDPLPVTVSRDIVLPWQQADLQVDYHGAAGEQLPQAPAPVTVLFLLDTSGSMSELLADEKRAILEMQRNLGAHGRPVRMGIMEFADIARVISPFTTDGNQLAAALQTMQPAAGGGTSFLVGLNAALEMLNEAGGTGTLIMLTDGGAGEDAAQLGEFFERRWKSAAHELYLVGIGNEGVNPASFIALTDDPARYILSSTDTRIIDLLFQEVALRMGNGLGRKGQLQLPLAEPLWDWGTDDGASSDGSPDDRIRLTPASQDPAVAAIGALFARPYQWRLPLAPRMGGILPTLHAPPALDYTTPDGETFRVRPLSDAVPKVLVVTWLFLFLLMLPALLYLLSALVAWWFRTDKIPDLEPIPWTPERRPAPNLPLRFAPEAERVRWSPTLVIGLGRTGRGVLTHLRQNLADSFDRDSTRPVLLALDLARDEVPQGTGKPFPGCLEPLGADQVFILPAASCALGEAIHRQRERVRDNPDDPAAGLDLTPYETLGADELRLAKGSSGRAPLARFALLRDLENGAGGALLTRLVQALDDWRRVAPEQRTRQIVLVANVQGGVGAGWLTDLLVLLRRLVAADEAAGRCVEINLLLAGDEQPTRGALVPLQAPQLFAELDRLSAAGARPFRHRLAVIPDEVLATLPPEAPPRALDGWVRKRPQDGVFVLPLRNDRNTRVDPLPVCADALTLLIDQQRRIELTYQLQSLAGAESGQRAADGRERYTQLVIHNAVFPRSFFRASLLTRLVVLFGGKQVLFPEREPGPGRGAPVLRRRPIDPAALCRADLCPDPLGVGQALTEAALGRCDPLLSLSLERDSLAEAANALRLAVITQGNRALQSRTGGLLGLAETAGTLSDHLRVCAARLGSPPAILDLAEGLGALRRQALTWIELFFGSAALVDLGQAAVLGDRGGVLAERAAESARLGETLIAWGRGASRVLVAPLSAADLADPRELDRTLDSMLLPFVATWLGTAEDLVARLTERCFWEVSAPGADGAPMGINLVLRGTQTRRYTPSTEELARFESDLRTEVDPVLDLANEYHVLALLAARFADDDDRPLSAFVERLKGDLRGDGCSLLATVPALPPGTPAGLDAFRDRLIKAITRLSSGAAAPPKVIEVRDRNRISVLQTLPLLTAAADTGSGEPIQRPERLFMRESGKLAAALGRESVDLPPALAVALQDPARLAQFARLYVNGQVRRHPLDGLWSVRTPDGQPRLATLSGQSLADAAGQYVTRGMDLPTDPCLADKPEADDGTDDFAAYLHWLANRE